MTSDAEQLVNTDWKLTIRVSGLCLLAVLICFVQLDEAPIKSEPNTVSSDMR